MGAAAKSSSPEGQRVSWQQRQARRQALAMDAGLVCGCCFRVEAGKEGRAGDRKMSKMAPGPVFPVESGETGRHDHWF
eukprot:349668-Chlamydomonas_euryale.AAC.4